MVRRVGVAALSLLLAASLTSAQEHSHSSHSGHEEADHSAVMSMPAETAPTLQAAPTLTAVDRVDFELATTRFEFSREHADQAHVPGEGHAHLYVNGEKAARVYSNRHSVNSLSPGVHTIRIGLFTNDHAAYAADGNPVVSTAVVLVPDKWRAPVEHRQFEVDVREGKSSVELIRVTQGELLTIVWTSGDVDAIELHLHGYDMTTELTSAKPLYMHLVADVAGRFPVAAHGHHGGADSHATVLYLEVYPD